MDSKQVNSHQLSSNIAKQRQAANYGNIIRTEGL